MPGSSDTVAMSGWLTFCSHPGRRRHALRVCRVWRSPERAIGLRHERAQTARRPTVRSVSRSLLALHPCSTKPRSPRGRAHFPGTARRTDRPRRPHLGTVLPDLDGGNAQIAASMQPPGPVAASPYKLWRWFGAVALQEFGRARKAMRAQAHGSPARRRHVGPATSRRRRAGSPPRPWPTEAHHRKMRVPAGLRLPPPGPPAAPGLHDGFPIRRAKDEIGCPIWFAPADQRVA